MLARIGVGTVAGQRTLTPMRWLTSVAAGHSVMPIEACLVTVYESVEEEEAAAEVTRSKVAGVTGGARAASGSIYLS